MEKTPRSPTPFLISLIGFTICFFLFNLTLNQFHPTNPKTPETYYFGPLIIQKRFTRESILRTILDSRRRKSQPLSTPSAPSANKTLYVSTSGSDDNGNNDCTDSGSPCLTIQHALNQTQDEGETNPDQVLVTAGTYPENLTINQKVELKGGYDTGFTNQTGLTTIDGTHSGPVINIPSDGNNPQHILLEKLTLANGYIEETTPESDLCGAALSTASNIEGVFVKNCVVEGNEVNNDDDQQGALAFDNTRGIQLEKNIIRNNSTNGVVIKESRIDSFEKNLLQGNEYGVIIYYNEDNNEPTNNIIVENDYSGVGLWQANATLRFNTIANNGVSGVYLYAVGTNTSSVALNQSICFNQNPCVHSGGEGNPLGEENTITFFDVLKDSTGNAWCSGDFPHTCDNGDNPIEPGDPFFTSDYHLLSDSDAINKTSVSTNKDIDEDNRPQQTYYDLGADEYVDTTTPTNTPIPTPTTTPIPTPTPDPCSQRSEGDADCNGLINDQDYQIWRCEFFNQEPYNPDNPSCPESMNQNARLIEGWYSNFSYQLDDHIDLIDYEIWRMNRT